MGLESQSLFLIFLSLDGVSGVSVRCVLLLVSLEKIGVEDFF